MSRKRAIRNFCISCMGGHVREVARCTATNCHLFNYKMGVKPKKSEFNTKINEEKIKEGDLYGERKILQENSL